MKILRSKWGTWLAIGYLILVLMICSPLILYGINHNTGMFLGAATVLTTPFSWILFFVIDNLSIPYAFYQTGSMDYVGMGVLGASAIMNAATIYYVIFTLERIISNFAKKKNLK
jgi:hypothetical protein